MTVNIEARMDLYVARNRPTCHFHKSDVGQRADWHRTQEIYVVVVGNVSVISFTLRRVGC